MYHGSELTVLFGATFYNKNVALHISLISSVVPSLVVKYGACGFLVLPVPAQSSVKEVSNSVTCCLPCEHGGGFHQQLTVITIGQLSLNTGQGSSNDMLE